VLDYDGSASRHGEAEQSEGLVVKEFWTRYGWWLLPVGMTLIVLIGWRFRPERVAQFARHKKERHLIQMGMSPDQVKSHCSSVIKRA